MNSSFSLRSFGFTLLFSLGAVLCNPCNLYAEEQEVPGAVETASPTTPVTPEASPTEAKPSPGEPKETGSKEETEQKNVQEDLQTKRQQVAQRVDDVQKSIETAKGSGTGVPESAERLSQEVELLKQLDVLYAQLQSAAEFRKETETTKQDLEKKLDDLRLNGLKEKSPYSFLALDGLRDSLATQESRATTLQAGAAAANESLTRAQQSFDQNQAERRRINEAAQANQDAAKSGEYALRLKLAELNVNIAQQTLLLRQAESANARVLQETQGLQLTLLREQIAAMERGAFFSEADLQTKLVDIEQYETRLKGDLQSGDWNLRYLDGKLSDVRRKLDSNPQPTAVEREEERSYKLSRDCQMRAMTLTQKNLERLGPLRQAWKRRREVAIGGTSRSDLTNYKAECLKTLQQLDLDRRLEELQLGEIRKELADLETRLQKAKNEDVDLVRWIDKEKSQYQNLLEAYNKDLISLETTKKLHQRLLDEVNGLTKRFSIYEWLAVAWRRTVAVWNYELTSFEDRSLTVGKVCIGIILLFGGIFLSRRISELIAKRVLPRVGIHDGAAVAIELLMFYALVLTTALMALHTINIPLTVFTFMGGAIAIGVGFGSQNLLNNFISGVILLIERPIRVGDAIEVANLHGLVEHIGVRSTRIRTGTNLEIIVPNSSFLEGNVVNWTLSDSDIRCCIKIGLAYGSPTREATRWLKRAADEHGLVLKRPEPFVWFTDFADNSLNFELHFWIAVRTLGDRKRIESDLRFMIDQYFREAGIVIAYPQRDVHLNTSTPFEIRMLPPGNPQSEEEGFRKTA